MTKSRIARMKKRLGEKPAKKTLPAKTTPNPETGEANVNKRNTFEEKAGSNPKKDVNIENNVAETQAVHDAEGNTVPMSNNSGSSSYTDLSQSPRVNDFEENDFSLEEALNQKFEAETPARETTAAYQRGAYTNAQVKEVPAQFGRLNNEVVSSQEYAAPQNAQQGQEPQGQQQQRRVPQLSLENLGEVRPIHDTEYTSNVKTLIKLVNELPEGVTKQTGAQIIRLTMEAMGIAMEEVLSEAQGAQSEMLEAVRANIKKIEEYKTVIRKLESDIKYYQGKANELSEIIDLFILSSSGKNSNDEQ